MSLSSKVTALFRKRSLDAEMSEEMRLHLERRAEENVAAGMPPVGARYTGRRQCDDVEQFKEAAREQRGWMGLENRLRDPRFGVTFCVFLGSSPGCE